MIRKRAWFGVLLLCFASSLYTQDAKKILERTGVQSGSCLVIDNNERLSLDLAEAGKLRIYLVNPEQKKVDDMRLKIDKAGKYGQITCRREDLTNILYPTYFFDLVVAGSIRIDKDRFTELFRLTRPGSKLIFTGACDAKAFLEKTDAPGAKQSKVEKPDGLIVVLRSHEPTNRHLKPPLVRLWVTRQTLEKCTWRKRGTGDIPVRYEKGSKGYVVRDGCLDDLPLDVYKGVLLPREKNYGKSDHQTEKTPYRYHGPESSGGRFGRHHGNHYARDLNTGKLIWTFVEPHMYYGSCSPLMYFNGTVYKSTYRKLLALDAHNGELLWQHRNGGHVCTGVYAARSILYQPNFGMFRMQAFISDIGWEKRIPKGDILIRSKAEIRNLQSAIRNPSDWPMFHHDACRTGRSPDKSIQAPLKLLWKFRTGGMVRSSPAAVGDTIFAGSCDNKFYALDTGSGKIKWSFFTDDEILSSPCVRGSTVYFGCDDGRVYALDKNTGKLIWSYRTATRPPRTPVYTTGFDDDKRWLQTMRSDPLMRMGYSPSRSFSPLVFNGKPLSTPGVVRSSPVVADGVLYVGTGLGQDAEPCWGFLYALDARTGKLVWKRSEEDMGEWGEHAFGISVSPCVEQGKVHFSYGTYNAMNVKDGKLLFKGGSTPGKRCGYGGYEKITPFYRNPDNNVVQYAVHSLTGPPTAVGAIIHGDVAISAEKRTALVCHGAFMHAIDADTGSVKWEGKFGARESFGRFFRFEKFMGRSKGNFTFHQPVAIDGDRVYLAGGMGIAVFDIEKGSSKKLSWRDSYVYNQPPWRESIYDPLSKLTGPEGLVNTAPAIANGFIFAGSDDGCIYAWDIKTEKMIWKHKTDGKVRSSPAVARGKLYIGSDDGYVYCFSNQ